MITWSEQEWRIGKPAIESAGGIVASQSRAASRIGAQVLRQGGNAVDAAIATSFALGAAEPWMSGIGGGGYMVVRQPEWPGARVVEFGMRAPAGLDLKDYPLVRGRASDLFPWTAVEGNRNVFGASAVAIPGQVAGMEAAHAAFGTLPWGDLVAPAAALAREGLLVDWYCQLILAGAARDLARFPASRAAFCDADGFPKASAWTALGSTRCDLGALAQTLGTIAREGPRAFYEGPLARSIVEDLQAAGGRHAMEDFSAYEARIIDASKTAYRGHAAFGVPDMTAGPTLARTLALLEGWRPDGDAPDAAAYCAYDAAIRQANAERYATMGDARPEPVPSCTTHFNVVDGDGLMVSVTQTLLSIFGSRMMLPQSGVLMNNGIMWFDPEQGKPNSLAPGKRCLSNMCPTLLERDDGARFALGAAGGRKIMPAVAQLTSFLLDFRMDPDAAIHTPRIDVSLAEATIVDEVLSAPVGDALSQRLAAVRFAPRTIYPYNFACPSLVARHRSRNAGATEIMAPWSAAVALD